LAAVVVEASTASRTTTLAGEGAQRIVTRVRDELHAHVIRLPVRYFDAAPAGELSSRILDDTDRLRGLIGPNVVSLSGAVIMAVVAFVIIAWVAWPIAHGLGILFSVAVMRVARAYAGVSAAHAAVCERIRGAAAAGGRRHGHRIRRHDVRRPGDGRLSHRTAHHAARASGGDEQRDRAGRRGTGAHSRAPCDA